MQIYALCNKLKVQYNFVEKFGHSFMVSNKWFPTPAARKLTLKYRLDHVTQGLLDRGACVSYVLALSFKTGSFFFGAATSILCVKMS